MSTQPCKTCKRPMTPLFRHIVCDWCDGLATPKTIDSGFVIWAASGELGPRSLYIFPTKDMADYYRRVSNTDGDVREVVSETTIKWWVGDGSLRHLQRSDSLYMIFPDFKFEPGPNRAFLKP